MAEEIAYPHWQTERTFVRSVSGKYSELYKQLYEQPRVFKTGEWPLTGKGAPQSSKFIISPRNTSAPLITQAIEVHLTTLAPGGISQKHGHMNSAVMYVLDGKGYDIHDRKHLDWQAGDALIIENGCVHQHFNLDPDRPGRVLVMKSKPLFLFFNLVFQKTVKLPTLEASTAKGVESDASPRS